MAATFFRLAFVDVSKRPLQTVLTAAVVAACAATLTLALAIGRVADGPWERTFAATRGPHVEAYGFAGVSLAPLADVPSVTEAAGPFRGVLTSFRSESREFGVRLEARPANPVRVDQPVVTAGGWLRRDAVVFERSFARAVGLEPGDRIDVVTTKGVLRLEVAGVAVTTTQERYPSSRPGLAYVLPDALRRIQPDEERWTSTLLLRLADPSEAAAFVRRAEAMYAGDHVAIDDWRRLRAEATRETRTTEIILSTFSVLLALALGFVLATTVGGRMLAQVREVGLLKAVGFTPGQVSGIFLVEHLVVGLVGAVVGGAVGVVIAPRFVHYSVEVVGGVPEPAFDPVRFVVAILVVEAVVGAFTLIPAWRSARRPTVELLARGQTAGRARLAAVAARLGLPAAVAVGLKDAFARPGRALITTLSLALTVAAVVGALSMEASFALAESASQTVTPASVHSPAAVGGLPVIDEAVTVSSDAARLRPVVYGLGAALLVVALVNLVTTALLAVRERTRDLAILRAVGFTPGQATASVTAASSLLGGLAAVAGIPLGVILFRFVYEIVNGSSDGAATPAWWALALVLPSAVCAVALLSALPARQAGRMRVVDALRSE